MGCDYGATNVTFSVGTYQDGIITIRTLLQVPNGTVRIRRAGESGSEDIEGKAWDLSGLQAMMRRALKAYAQDESSHLDSIGICTWGANFGILCPDRTWHGDIRAYMDPFLVKHGVETVRSKINLQRIYEITGVHPEFFNVSGDLADRTEPGKMPPFGSWMVPMPSLLYYYLGRKLPPFVDSTWASVTQLVGKRTGEWSRAVCEALGIPMSMLPRIVEPGTVVGRARGVCLKGIRLGNPVSLVAVPMHDTGSAFSVAQVDRPEDVLVISAGSWLLIGKLLKEALTSTEAMKAGLSNERCADGYFRCLQNCRGMAIVEALRKEWAVADGRTSSWQELDQLAMVAGEPKLFVDPRHRYFEGDGSMATAIAQYCANTGQEVPVARGEMLRVVYRSLAMQARAVSEDLARLTGQNTKVVNILGGPSQNKFLCQDLANAFGMKVIAGPQEAATMGLMAAQVKAHGLVGTWGEVRELARRSSQVVVYNPENREGWDQTFCEYKRICASI